MKLRKVKKHEVILNEGEKGKEFFILLKGKISILTPKIIEYYMSVEEYILYLFQLRLKEQNELIHKCISLNQNIYPIEEDNFDIFIFNLSEGKTINEFYSKNINLILKSKKIVKYLLEEKKKISFWNNQDIQNNKKIIISPEEYIIQNSVPDEVIKKNILIQNYLTKIEGKNVLEEIKNESLDKDDDESNINKTLLNNRNKIFIPTHEIFGELEIGSCFGEIALEEKGNGKRNATLIAIEDSYLGVIDKKNYYYLLHFYIEKAQNKYLNFISSFYIFKNISLNVWEKKYMSFFINKVYDKDYLLLKEGESIDQIFFIYKGEFEFTTNKNLIELNELIIYYKKILHELLSKNKNNINKKMIKLYDIKEEIRENDNFIMNQKFRGENLTKMIFDKKIIKLGIFSSKEIIGLLDIYSSIKYNQLDSNDDKNNFRIKKYKMISLYNCKCISCNCEVYSFPLSSFKYICSEDKVGDLTNELEIQKICYMIKRLKHYKEYLFESVYLKEKDNNKNIIKNKKNKSMNKGKKNKFDPISEYSNINFKHLLINNNLPKKKKFINGFLTERTLSNSFSNYILSNISYEKYKNKNKLDNWKNKTNYKYLKNNERLKIKQHFLGLPKIDKIKKNKEQKKKIINEKSIKLKTENDNNNNNNLLYNTNVLSDNKNNIISINIFSSKNNNSNNIDKINFRKKPLINNYNWVKKIMVKNIVYNYIFDKFAFSSNKITRNNNKNTFNLNNNLKTSDDSVKSKKVKDKQSLINNFEIYSNKKFIKNKSESKIIIKKINKSLSSINKIKNMKIQDIDNNKMNKNRIYDALIFDTFNKHFNENIYNKYFE